MWFHHVHRARAGAGITTHCFYNQFQLSSQPSERHCRRHTSVKNTSFPEGAWLFFVGTQFPFVFSALSKKKGRLQPLAVSLITCLVPGRMQMTAEC